MPTCAYPSYTQLWFWFVALGILFFSIGIIIWDVRSSLSSSWWVWALIALGAILFLIGFLLALWQWWNNQYSDIPTNQGVIAKRYPVAQQSKTVAIQQPVMTSNRC